MTEPRKKPYYPYTLKQRADVEQTAAEFPAIFGLKGHPGETFSINLDACTMPSLSATVPVLAVRRIRPTLDYVPHGKYTPNELLLVIVRLPEYCFMCGTHGDYCGSPQWNAQKKCCPDCSHNDHSDGGLEPPERLLHEIIVNPVRRVAFQLLASGQIRLEYSERPGHESPWELFSATVLPGDTGRALLSLLTGE